MTVVFDQAMDTGVDPTLTFGTDVAGTLTFTGGVVERGDTTYTATYNVADANVDMADVTIDVTGAQDATGNAQADYTPEAEFSIDTANPSVVSVDGERHADHGRGHGHRQLHGDGGVRPGDGHRRRSDADLRHRTSPAR